MDACLGAAFSNDSGGSLPLFWEWSAAPCPHSHSPSAADSVLPASARLSRDAVEQRPSDSEAFEAYLGAWASSGHVYRTPRNARCTHDDAAGVPSFAWTLGGKGSAARLAVSCTRYESVMLSLSGGIRLLKKHAPRAMRFSPSPPDESHHAAVAGLARATAALVAARELLVGWRNLPASGIGAQAADLDETYLSALSTLAEILYHVTVLQNAVNLSDAELSGAWRRVSGLIDARCVTAVQGLCPELHDTLVIFGLGAQAEACKLAAACAFAEGEYENAAALQRFVVEAVKVALCDRAQTLLHKRELDILDQYIFVSQNMSHASAAAGSAEAARFDALPLPPELRLPPPNSEWPLHRLN